VELILIVFALAAYAHWVEPAQLVVRRVDVPIAGLPVELSGYTILVSSDLHSAWFGQGQARVDRVLGAEAAVVSPDRLFDAAVFAGDLIDAHRPDPAAGEAFLRVLTSWAPTIFTVGNHDLLSLDAVLAAAERTGATVPGLGAPGGTGYALVRGPDSPAPPVAFVGTTRLHPEAEDLRAAVERARETAPLVVVVLHGRSPTLLRAAREGGAELVVAGHDHGGQVALPFVGPIWTPTGGWFPGRASGLFREEGIQLFVSRGLGTSVMRVRLFSPPTLDLLRLVPADTG